MFQLPAHHSLTVDLNHFVSGVDPLGLICWRVLGGPGDDVETVVRGFDVNAQTLPRFDVSDVDLLETRQVAVGGVRGQLGRLVTDAVQGFGLKHTFVFIMR